MDLILRTTVIFALAFALAAMLRRAAPATRHLLWHVTMLIVVAAPLIQPISPRISLPRLRSPLEAAAVALDNSVTPASVARAFRPAGSALAGLKDCATDADCARDGWTPSLSTIWIAGSLMTAAWFAIGYAISLWLRRGASWAPVAIQLAARTVARDLNLKRAPEILLTHSAYGPLTVGIVRPFILLPATALEWSAERQRAVLAHELAHVRRGDTRIQALAHMACALYWFNPLAWMAARALRRERERACDDAVIASGVRPSSYAQDLLDIARGMSRELAPSAGLAMARRSELEGRLLSLLTGDHRRQPTRGTKVAVTCAMALCATISFGAHPAGRTSGTGVATSRQLQGASLWRDGERLREAQQGERDRSARRKLAQSGDAQVREQAVLQLAVSGETSATAALISALSDDSAQVREKAAMGLALRSSADVVEPLLHALRDSDAQVREKAAIGLSLRRDPRVVDALLVAIKDVDGQVREKAAIALGTSGDSRAIDALKAAMHDADEQVREKAAMGIVLLTSSPMGPIDRRELESGLTWAVNAVLRAIQ